MIYSVRPALLASYKNNNNNPKIEADHLLKERKGETFDSCADMSSGNAINVVGYAQKLFDSSKWYILIYTVIAAVYVASIPRKWIWFNWHPLSMIVSFILLSSFAALIKKIGGYENTKLHGTNLRFDL